MKHIKKFEDLNEEQSWYDEDEGMIEGYLTTLFSDYFNLDYNVSSRQNPYDTTGYKSHKIFDNRKDDNIKDEDKKEVFMVQYLDIDIFELEIDYLDGILNLGKIIHRNHLMDLIKKNWDLLQKYQYEKMKKDLL